ncbi:MAG: hypothetical protein Q9228_007629, partial [Teloschistes exilis]
PIVFVALPLPAVSLSITATSNTPLPTGILPPNHPFCSVTHSSCTCKAAQLISPLANTSLITKLRVGTGSR